MSYQSIHTGNDIDTGITNIQQIFDLIYPIGSYYMSSDSANPSTKFGGTWEQITLQKKKKKLNFQLIQFVCLDALKEKNIID